MATKLSSKEVAPVRRNNRRALYRAISVNPLKAANQKNQNRTRRTNTMKLNEKNAQFAVIATAFHGGGVISFHNSLERLI